MRAGFYERCGAAAEVLRVGDLPVPEPGPGEVLVRVHASGVNPSDVKARAGSRGMLFDRVVPHSDGAGVIESVGSGVASDLVGQRVWLYEAQWRRPSGTAAEHTVVPAERAAPLPGGTSFVEGACLGIPAMTAHRCVFADGPVTGRTVLVSGGTGRVGFYAVQLARWGGATVIATVGSAEKAALAEKAGAHHVLNYRRENVASAARDLTGGAGVDRVVEVELGVNLETNLALLASQGVIATYASTVAPEPPVPVYPLMFKNATLRFVLVYDMPEEAKRAAIEDINGLLEQGWLQHQVGLVVPLERLVEAHEAIEQDRVVGCIVVEVTPQEADA